LRILGGRPFEENREFVAAQAGDRVGGAERVVEAVVEEGSVRETGQRVVERLVRQLRFQRLPLGG
jgi:hypothetical protein